MELGRPVWIIAIALGLLACGADARIGRARHASYDADLPIVLDAVIEATAKYRRATASPDKRLVKTAWVQVDTGMGGTPTPTNTSRNGIGYPARAAPARYFIRFDVRIVGARPYRIEVEGYASEWIPGMAEPTDLKDDTEPGWLVTRRDSLMVSIHERLAAHVRATLIVVDQAAAFA